MPPVPRPNIIVIMTDQQRADLCARREYALDTTPFLDRLAARGADFPVTYTSVPVCGPARVSFFTGRFPSVHGARTNANISDAYYHADLVDVLREQGYTTGLCGKNHSHVGDDRWDWSVTFGHDNSHEPERSEAEKAFDAWLHSLRHMAAHEPAPFPLACQFPCRIVRHAQDWIENQDQDPFFLWMSFPEPHNPFQVPEPYYSMFPPETLPPVRADESALAGKGERWRWLHQKWKDTVGDFARERERTRANYHGMLRLLDDQVKRFVEWLESTGRLENTVLVFTSDHGDFVGEYGLIRKGPDLPDCLARIPLIVVGPGIAPGVHEQVHASLCDIMPTLCHAAGAAVPPGVQGRSLWPLLQGGEADPGASFASVYAEHGLGGERFTAEDMAALADPEVPLPHCTLNCLNNMTQTGVTRMVRQGDWKLVADEQGRHQLFNLADDPAEVDDCFGRPECRDIQAQLQTELITWLLRMQDTLPLPRDTYRVKTRDAEQHVFAYQEKV